MESKATGFLRKALATGDKVAIDNSVSQVIAGLIQLHEFKDACERHAVGLDRFHSCSDFKLLVVTFEPFHLINSVIFQERMNEQLSEKLAGKSISIAPWRVLQIDHLEKLQPHIAAGIELKSVIERLENNEIFNTILKEIAEQTGRGYQDSFLYEMDMEIYRRLNIPVDYGE